MKPILRHLSYRGFLGLTVAESNVISHSFVKTKFGIRGKKKYCEKKIQNVA